MKTKIVYGVKFYILNVGTEFEIYEKLSEAERFWDNDFNGNIMPMRLVELSAFTKELFLDECGKLLYSDKGLDYSSFKTLRTNA